MFGFLERRSEGEMHGRGEGTIWLEFWKRGKGVASHDYRLYRDKREGGVVSVLEVSAGLEVGESAAGLEVELQQPQRQLLL